MKVHLILLVLAGLLVGCLPTGDARLLHQSKVFPVDRRIAPESALQSGESLVVFEDQPAELVWLSSWAIEVVDEKGQSPPGSFSSKLSDSTLDFRWPKWHNEQFDSSQSSRLFSLGRGVPQLRFPPGFGIPLRSNERLWWTSRIINQDPYFPATNLRQESRMEVTRERGLRVNYHPLLSRNATVKADGVSPWPVPPGGRPVRQDITQSLLLPTKTTLHAATICMHSWAERAELWDSSQEQLLLTFQVRRDEKSGDVLEIETYSDAKGVLLDPTHRYHLSVIYDNPTDRDIRGVGYFMAYIFDHGFRKPAR